MAGIGIIANPHSKLNKRNPEKTQLLSYIAGQAGVFRITNCLDELSKVAIEFHNRAIEILAINGGDGTVSRTITAFIRVYQGKPLPKLVLLNGGTMNMLADNLQVSGKPEEILCQLIEGHSEEKKFPEISLATLKINNDFGFLYTDGLSVNFLREFYKNKSGKMGALLLGLKVTLSNILNKELSRKIVKEQVLTALSSDAKIKTSALSVFCATVQQIPMNIRLFEVVENNDKFSVLIQNFKTEEFLSKYLKSLLIKTDQPGYGKINFEAETLCLRYEDPQYYTIDGEVYYEESGEINIGLGPKLVFIRP